jgi:hypothetical protein
VKWKPTSRRMFLFPRLSVVLFTGLSWTRRAVVLWPEALV